MFMGKLLRGSDRHVVICYAEGHEGAWEAFCLNFDLSVQGKTFQEVYDKLAEALELYLQGVFSLPEADQKRLLKRRAPLSAWAGFLLRMFKIVFTKRDDKLRHEYTLPARWRASVA
jgi:predicted RNase H-like HicB family nuclease